VISLRVEGGEKLMKALGELPNRVSRSVQREALKVGGEKIRQAARAIAPRAPGAPDMADHIEIGNARTDDGSVGISIGPTKGFFYGHFQEFGTTRHGAQPFLRPAFDSEGGTALKLISAETWAALIRKGGGSGRGSGGGVGL